MKRTTGVRFFVPDVEIDLRFDEVEALREELAKIAAIHPPAPAAASLIDALQLHVGELNATSPRFTPRDEEWKILARAADHLRNLGRDDQDLFRLRGLAIGICRLESKPYQLRNYLGGESFGFVSHSGTYEMDDRLVHGNGDEYKIVGLELDGEGFVVRSLLPRG